MNKKLTTVAVSGYFDPIHVGHLEYLHLAKKLGATDSSIVVSNSISETVNFRNKKLDESNRSDNLGIGITTYIEKKKSSISSSNLFCF